MKSYGDEEGSKHATSSRRHDARVPNNVARGVALTPPGRIPGSEQGRRHPRWCNLKHRGLTEFDSFCPGNPVRCQLHSITWAVIKLPRNL